MARLLALISKGLLKVEPLVAYDGLQQDGKSHFQVLFVSFAPAIWLTTDGDRALDWPRIAKAGRIAKQFLPASPIPKCVVVAL